MKTCECYKDEYKDNIYSQMLRDENKRAYDGSTRVRIQLII